MNLQIKLVRLALKAHALALLLTVLNPACPAAFAFEGLITATLTRGGDTSSLLYTADKNVLRIERTETDWPHAKNIVNLKSGAVTLVFPHNRSFVRLKSAASDASTSPGFPALPPGIGPKTPSALQPPPGIGPTNPPGASQLPQVPAIPQPPGGLPPGIGPQPGHNPGASQLPGISTVPGAAGFPAMPMMPMPGDKLELEATSEKKTILGYECVRHILKHRGETMEIWATDKLLPFQSHLQHQPPRFGPRMIEEQWGETLKAKKLFPLLVILKFEGGPERMRFEVKSVTPGKIEDKDGTIFQPPSDYHELEALPF